MTKKDNDLENLAELVASGSTIRDAAESIGIPVHAAYKITCTDLFRQRVRETKSERTELIAAQALDAAIDSIRELRTLATTAEKDSDRIAACKTILSQVMPLAEHSELRRRIDDIEQRAATSEARQDREGEALAFS